MEFVITQGQVQLAPIPPADPEAAAEGKIAGYMLNVTDAATGIVIRVSMEHGNAAQLGRVLVDHTDAHPAHKAANIETFQAIPGGLENGGQA